MLKKEEPLGSDVKDSYWQDYYAKQKTASASLPSQFSVFVAGELQIPHRIFDIGCGSGRDSLLFASHGHEVTGIDGSQAAVDFCRETAEKTRINASFVCSQINASDLAGKVESRLDTPTLVYARFFLHAITESEEASFFELAKSLTANGGALAVEFRTIRDADQEKVTGSHYRRFIDPLLFLKRATAHDFTARYFVEGFGFAKYKNDDAHVARFLFERGSAGGG